MAHKKHTDAAELLKTALADPSASRELTQDLRGVFIKHFGPLENDAEITAADEESGGGGHRPPPTVTEPEG